MPRPRSIWSRARAHGTRVSEEIRSAVDAYLAGIAADELQLLDAASRAAAADLEAMRTTLAETNRKLDELFARIERERARAP